MTEKKYGVGLAVAGKRVLPEAGGIGVTNQCKKQKFSDRDPVDGLDTFDEGPVRSLGDGALEERFRQDLAKPVALIPWSGIRGPFRVQIASDVARDAVHAEVSRDLGFGVKQIVACVQRRANGYSVERSRDFDEQGSTPDSPNRFEAALKAARAELDVWFGPLPEADK